MEKFDESKEMALRAGVDAGAVEYVEREILPRYEAFDRAHRRDHAHAVICRSLALAARMPDLDPTMVYLVAAFHDTGLVNGRERHHWDSGAILRADRFVAEHFSAGQITLMVEAVEDHRASNRSRPRNMYGLVVAEADRMIDAETIVTRTVQYGLSHYPELDREEHYARTLGHLTTKYGPDGYLKIWVPWSDNAARLADLHRLIDDTTRLRAMFDRIYDRETAIR